MMNFRIFFSKKKTEKMEKKFERKKQPKNFFGKFLLEIFFCYLQIIK